MHCKLLVYAAYTPHYLEHQHLEEKGAATGLQGSYGKNQHGKHEAEKKFIQYC